MIPNGQIFFFLLKLFIIINLSKYKILWKYLVLRVGLRHLLHHHHANCIKSLSWTKWRNIYSLTLGELHGAAPVNVHLVDDVLHLGVSRVLAQGPHHGG